MVRAVGSRGWLLVALAFFGCRAGGGGGAPPPSGPGAGFVVTERAESGPITALDLVGTYLWAAGPGGLRRWDLEDGTRELIGPDDRGPVDAILADDEGGAWVSAGGALGRWREDEKAGFRFESQPSPGRLTLLVAQRSGAEVKIWGGGPDGLFRFDAGGWMPVAELREIAVTALLLDGDRNAWAGTRARGIYRLDGEGGGGEGGGRNRPRAAAVAGGDAIVLDAVAGIGKSASGTRLAAGNVGGEARLYALTMAGVEGFRAAGARVIDLVDRRQGALLVAQAAPGADPQPYSLRSFGPGEPIPAGSLRFNPVVPERGGRWAAIPAVDRLPSGITAAVANDNDIYCGTERLGVVRAGPDRPQPLEGGDLVGGGARLSVFCLAAGRCYLVTGGPTAWLTDGDRYERASVGEPKGAVVQALTGDARGNLYAVAAESQPPGLSITRLTPATAGNGNGASNKDGWTLLHRVALDLPPKKAPAVAFAAVSPAGVLWVGLRARGAAANGGQVRVDDDAGHGAVEIELGNGHAVQHRPRRPNEKLAPEALPLASDLTGILFDGSATWFSSLSGVSRFHEGQLESWGENDGLASERVHAIGRAGGAIWAATSAGLASHESAGWRPRESGGMAARGFVTDETGKIWVATSKGLRLLESQASELAVAPLIAAGDFRDVTVDRFGRVWAMSSTSIVFVRRR